MSAKPEILPTLTVVVPAYNEAGTLRASVERLRDVPEVTEIVIVDDGSSDATPRIAEELARETQPAGRLKAIVQPENHGKGAAVRAGIASATGDYVCVHDADLEYDPADLATMLRYAAEHDIPALYGSRLTKKDHRRGAAAFYLGGRVMTIATNCIYGCSLTDEPTCYKMVRTDLLKRLDLQSTGFEFCPEVTGKLLRAGYAIEEIPIGYEPRSIAEGKKIRAKDAWIGLRELLKWRFRRPVTRKDNGA